MSSGPALLPCLGAVGAPVTRHRDKTRGARWTVALWMALAVLLTASACQAHEPGHTDPADASPASSDAAQAHHRFYERMLASGQHARHGSDLTRGHAPVERRICEACASTLARLRAQWDEGLADLGTTDARRSRMLQACEEVDRTHHVFCHMVVERHHEEIYDEIAVMGDRVRMARASSPDHGTDHDLCVHLHLCHDPADSTHGHSHPRDKHRAREATTARVEALFRHVRELRRRADPTDGPSVLTTDADFLERKQQLAEERDRLMAHHATLRATRAASTQPDSATARDLMFSRLAALRALSADELENSPDMATMEERLNALMQDVRAAESSLKHAPSLHDHSHRHHPDPHADPHGDEL